MGGLFFFWNRWQLTACAPASIDLLARGQTRKKIEPLNSMSSCPRHARVEEIVPEQSVTKGQ